MATNTQPETLIGNNAQSPAYNFECAITNEGANKKNDGKDKDVCRLIVKLQFYNAQNLTLSSSTLSLAGHVLWYFLEGLSTYWLDLAALALGLVGRLAVFQFLQRSCLRGRTNLALLGRLLANIIQRGTYHRTLNFSCTAISLFGRCLRQTLLVQTPPSLRPYQFGSLFTLHREGESLRGSQPDGPTIAANHQFTISRVDTVL